MYQQEITESGFYNGTEWETVQEVKAYFTVENMVKMFGECVWSQETLDEMLSEVLVTKEHCTF